MNKIVLAIHSFFGLELLKKKPGKTLLFCCILAVSIIVPSLQLQELLPALENVAEEELTKMLNNPIGVLSIVVFAPIFEELIFRASILRFLLFICKKLKWNHWIAITLSAMIFAGAHMNPAQIIHPFLIGLLLGWIFFRTKSVLPCILIHFINNTMAFIIYLANPNPQANVVGLLGSPTILFLGLSIVILVFSIIKLNKIMNF